jgi:hypothetical protein
MKASIQQIIIVLIMALMVSTAIVVSARADEHGYTGDGTFKDK